MPDTVQRDTRQIVNEARQQGIDVVVAWNGTFRSRAQQEYIIEELGTSWVGDPDASVHRDHRAVDLAIRGPDGQITNEAEPYQRLARIANKHNWYRPSWTGAKGDWGHFEWMPAGIPREVQPPERHYAGQPLPTPAEPEKPAPEPPTEPAVPEGEPTAADRAKNVAKMLGKGYIADTITGLMDQWAILGAGHIAGAYVGDEPGIDEPYSEFLKRRKAGGQFRSELTKQQIAWKGSEALQEWVEKNLPDDPRLREDFWFSQVPRGFGQMGSYMTLAMLTGGGIAPVALLGASMEGAGAYRRIGAAGGTPDQEIAALLPAWGLGATEIIPISRLLTRLDRGTGGLVKRILLNTAFESVEEGAQELGQQLGGNIVHNFIMDAKEDIWKGTGTGAGVGMVSGGLMAFIMTLAQAAIPGKVRGRPGAPAAAAPAEEAPAKEAPADEIVAMLGEETDPEAIAMLAAEDVGEGAQEVARVIMGKGQKATENEKSYLAEYLYREAMETISLVKTQKELDEILGRLEAVHPKRVSAQTLKDMNQWISEAQENIAGKPTRPAEEVGEPEKAEYAGPERRSFVSRYSRQLAERTTVSVLDELQTSMEEDPGWKKLPQGQKEAILAKFRKRRQLLLEESLKAKGPTWKELGPQGIAALAEWRKRVKGVDPEFDKKAASFADEWQKIAAMEDGPAKLEKARAFIRFVGYETELQGKKPGGWGVGEEVKEAPKLEEPKGGKAQVKQQLIDVRTAFGSKVPKKLQDRVAQEEFKNRKALLLEIEKQENESNRYGSTSITNQGRALIRHVKGIAVEPINKFTEEINRLGFKQSHLRRAVFSQIRMGNIRPGDWAAVRDYVEALKKHRIYPSKELMATLEEKAGPAKVEGAEATETEFEERLRRTGAARTPEGTGYKIVTTGGEPGPYPSPTKYQVEIIRDKVRKTVVGMRGEEFSGREAAVNYAILDARKDYVEAAPPAVEKPPPKPAAKPKKKPPPKGAIEKEQDDRSKGLSDNLNKVWADLKTLLPDLTGPVDAKLLKGELEQRYDRGFQALIEIDDLINTIVEEQIPGTGGYAGQGAMELTAEQQKTLDEILELREKAIRMAPYKRNYPEPKKALSAIKRVFTYFKKQDDNWYTGGFEQTTILRERIQKIVDIHTALWNDEQYELGIQVQARFGPTAEREKAKKKATELSYKYMGHVARDGAELVKYVLGRIAAADPTPAGKQEVERISQDNMIPLITRYAKRGEKPKDHAKKAKVAPISADYWAFVDELLAGMTFEGFDSLPTVKNMDPAVVKAHYEPDQGPTPFPDPDSVGTDDAGNPVVPEDYENGVRSWPTARLEGEIIELTRKLIEDERQKAGKTPAQKRKAGLFTTEEAVKVKLVRDELKRIREERDAILKAVGMAQDAWENWKTEFNKTRAEKKVEDKDDRPTGGSSTGSASMARDPKRWGFHPKEGLTEQERVLARDQMIAAAVQATNIPWRYRLFGGTGRAAIFKIREAVMRARRGYYTNVGTFAHEFGHAFHKFVLGTTKKGRLRVRGTFLTKFTKELKKLSYTDKPGKMTLEGLAEFFRYYITDPKYAKEHAPEFYKFFEQDFLGRVLPEMKEALLRLRQDYETYERLDWKTRMKLAVRRDTPETGMATSAVTLFKLVTDQMLPMKEIYKKITRGEKLRADEDMDILLDLAAGSVAEAESWIEYNGYQRSFENKGVSIGKSLLRIMQPIGQRLEDQEFYMLASRALERRQYYRGIYDGYNEQQNIRKAEGPLPRQKHGRLSQYEEKAYRNGVAKGKALGASGQELQKETIRKATRWRTVEEFGFEHEDIEQAFEELHSEEFRKVADDFREFNANLVRYFGAAARWTQAKINRILSSDVTYVPTYRILEDPLFTRMGKKERKVGGRKIGSRWVPIGRRQGGDLPIASPVEATVKNVFTLIRRANEVNIVNTLVEVAERYGDIKPGSGNFIEEVPREMMKVMIPTKMVIKQLGITDLDEEIEEEWIAAFTPSQFKPGGNVVRLSRGEKVQDYWVDPAIYEVLEGLHEDTVNTMTKILLPLAKATRIHRVGITMTIRFALRNIFKDAQGAMLRSENFWKLLRNLPRAWWEIVHAGELYSKLKAAGTGMATFQSRKPKDIYNRLIEAVRVAEYHPRWTLLKIFRHPVMALEQFSETFENATRMAEMLAQGLEKATTKEEMARIGIAGRRITIDFGRGGKVTKAINPYSMFLNAKVQGLSWTYQTFKKNPKKVALMGLAKITAPTLLYYLWQRKNPCWQNTEQQQKDTHWIVWMPWQDCKKGDDPYRFPKPHEFGWIFATPVERFLEFIDGYWTRGHGDPKKMEQLLAHWLKDTLPMPTPTFAMPILEVGMNHQFYFDRPIVAERLEEIDPQYQYNARTTTIMKVIGRAIGYSPAKMEHLVENYFGTMGWWALEWSDMILKKLSILDDRQRPAKGPGGGMITGGFRLSWPRLNTEPVREFWDIYAWQPPPGTPHRAVPWKKLGIKVLYDTMKQRESEEDWETADRMADTFAEKLDWYEDFRDQAKLMRDSLNEYFEAERSRKFTPEQLREKYDAAVKEYNRLAIQAVNKYREYDRYTAPAE
jgi:hypothetical protein